MQIIDLKLHEIRAYKNNPRHNEQAVDSVAESISKFGFKVPIVIDRNHVIVTGHTRYKAAIQLGLETVPCLIADDLNDDQIKAFRLVDNKVGEIATWDWDALNIELADIDLDMADFGFELKLEDTADEEPIEYDNSSEELNVDEFSDEKYNCECPKCGFRFEADTDV